jgi:hypothetical protein
MMMRKYCFLLIGLISLFACSESKKEMGSKKIVMRDAANIITESDSQFTANIVEDITQKQNTNSKQQITAIIQQVDSAKEAKQIADNEVNDVSGTNIECKDFKVTINALMNQQGDHYTLDKAEKLNDASIQINGILEPVVQQRFFTKLKITVAGQTYLLDELLENANPWVTLNANANVFTGANNGNLSFRNVDARSILLATDRAMRKAGKSLKELEAMKKELANTNKFSDAPCSLVATAIHYKISGLKNNKKVSESIKISLLN